MTCAAFSLMYAVVSMCCFIEISRSDYFKLVLDFIGFAPSRYYLREPVKVGISPLRLCQEYTPFPRFIWDGERPDYTKRYLLQEEWSDTFVEREENEAIAELIRTLIEYGARA